MVGVSNWLQWLAWFCKYVSFLFVTVAVMTLLFCLPLTRHGSVVGHTNPSVLFVFLLTYAMATISYAFLLSTFFSKGCYKTTKNLNSVLELFLT